MAGLSQSRHSTKVGVAIVIATEYIEANKQSPVTYTRLHTYTLSLPAFRIRNQTITDSLSRPTVRVV